MGDLATMPTRRLHVGLVALLCWVGVVSVVSMPDKPEAKQLSDRSHSITKPVPMGAVPSGGECADESDTTSVGNHCVKLTGAKLDQFQKNTNQDFGSPTQWCVCLHLYAEQKSKIASLSGDADCSKCSSGAMKHANLQAC